MLPSENPVSAGPVSALGTIGEFIEEAVFRLLSFPIFMAIRRVVTAQAQIFASSFKAVRKATVFDSRSLAVTVVKVAPKKTGVSPIDPIHD